MYSKSEICASALARSLDQNIISYEHVFVKRLSSFQQLLRVLFNSPFVVQQNSGRDSFLLPLTFSFIWLIVIGYLALPRFRTCF